MSLLQVLFYCRFALLFICLIVSFLCVLCNLIYLYWGVRGVGAGGGGGGVEVEAEQLFIHCCCCFTLLLVYACLLACLAALSVNLAVVIIFCPSVLLVTLISNY